MVEQKEKREQRACPRESVRIWEFTQETTDLKWNYRHRTREEPLGNGSNFFFEEVNKDLRRSKKE